MTKSRAVRFDRFGDRSVLYIADVPVPTPSAGEVVVEVTAAGINPGEVNIRSGALANVPDDLPVRSGQRPGRRRDCGRAGRSGFAIG